MTENFQTQRIRELSVLTDDALFEKVYSLEGSINSTLDSENADDYALSCLYDSRDTCVGILATRKNMDPVQIRKLYLEWVKAKA